MIYSSLFVLAAFVKWFEYDSECIAYVLVDLFITHRWDRERNVEVVTLWVCHRVMVWDTCSDMFLDRKQTPPVLHCDWSVWWHATHSSTYPKALKVDPHHLVCLWSGHHAINHIPETGFAPFQTFQGLWINSKWPSIISQRPHSKHAKGTPRWPLPSGLYLKWWCSHTINHAPHIPLHHVCISVTPHALACYRKWPCIPHPLGKPHLKKLDSVRLQTQSKWTLTWCIIAPLGLTRLAATLLHSCLPSCYKAICIWPWTLDPWLLTLNLWSLTFDPWPMTLDFDRWPLTFDHWLWSLTFDICPLAVDLWHLTYDLQPMTLNLWPLTLDLWPLTHIIWPLTFDLWPLTCVLWPMTFDMWPLNLTLDIWPLAFQPRPLTLEFSPLTFDICPWLLTFDLWPLTFHPWPSCGDPSMH